MSGPSDYDPRGFPPFPQGPGTPGPQDGYGRDDTLIGRSGQGFPQQSGGPYPGGQQAPGPSDPWPFPDASGSQSGFGGQVHPGGSQPGGSLPGGGRQQSASLSQSMAPGTVIASTFQIEQRLAEGGMGAIYLARHITLGTPRAIKVILSNLASDPMVVELFKAEVGALQAIRHDAVAGAESLLSDPQGGLCFVMEYVDGPSLEARYKQRPLSDEEVLTLAERLAGGLQAAHDKGKVHRDMSPDNVLLHQGRIDQAKIIDFGIAKDTTEGAKTILDGTFGGKYTWTSPEQLGLFPKVDARTDIYSLGLVLVAAALGEALKMGGSEANAILSRRALPDLSRLSPALLPLISKMLVPDPEQRIRTMREVEALARAMREGRAPPPSSGGKSGPGLRAEPQGRRERTPVPAADDTAEKRTREPERSSGRGGLVLALLGMLVIGGASAGAWFSGLLDPWLNPEPIITDPRGNGEVLIEGTGGSGNIVETPPITDNGGGTEVGNITEPPDLPDPQDIIAALRPNTGERPQVTLQNIGDGVQGVQGSGPGEVGEQPIGDLAALLPGDVTEQPIEEPIRPGTAALSAAIADIVGSVDCGSVTSRVAGDGTVTTRGIVGSVGELASLESAVRAVDGVSALNSGVRILPPPLCQVAGGLDIYSMISTDGEPGPRLRLNKSDGVYQVGDRLMLDATNAASREGYLIIDFFQADGNVVHLTPSWHSPSEALRNGQSLTFGAQSGQREYEISDLAPDEMLVAIWSPVAVFADSFCTISDKPYRCEIERAEDYLPALTAALDQVRASNPGAAPSASLAVLTYRP